METKTKKSSLKFDTTWPECESEQSVKLKKNYNKKTEINMTKKLYKKTSRN